MIAAIGEALGLLLVLGVIGIGCMAAAELHAAGSRWWLAVVAVTCLAVVGLPGLFS